MVFEWKDIITPVATLTAVWLGANFTLRNEIRKKALEIQSQKLEQLSLEIEQILMNLMRYTLTVRNTLNDLSSGSKNDVTLTHFADVMRDYKDAGIIVDFDRVICFQNSLEFHRPVEYELWMMTVRPLLNQLSATLSWQSLNDRKNAPEKTWKAHEIRDYCHDLEKKIENIKTLRKQLVSLLSEDFKKLTHASDLNFWTMLRTAKRVVQHFFRKPPVSPS
ncbi:hypothetical protein YA29_16505 [Klebsiella aerogenes]|uniref:hypothetical protein n=1 Tax=Klebsiella aerogenes TaxID=548 RepID=UPI00063CAED2|nr:hypothetical protein [Klebsiella aerogenes]KLF28684.1 hypothetical protein YA29_16505 [Klebsiella aerogenes]